MNAKLDDLRKAFAIATTAAEDPDTPRSARIHFSSIAHLIWNACGKDVAPGRQIPVGSIRIKIEGPYCNPFLGGQAEDACLFKSVEAACAEMITLGKTSNREAINAWEYQELRADGLWAAVGAGEFAK